MKLCAPLLPVAAVGPSQHPSADNWHVALVECFSADALCKNQKVGSADRSSFFSIVR